MPVVALYPSVLFVYKGSTIRVLLQRKIEVTMHKNA